MSLRESIDHLCNNPILSLSVKLIYDLHEDKWNH